MSPVSSPDRLLVLVDRKVRAVASKRRAFRAVEDRLVLKPGLDFTVVNGDFSRLPTAWAELKVRCSGVVHAPSLAELQRANGLQPCKDGQLWGFENFAVQFKGYLRTPTAGNYRFYLTSNDGRWENRKWKK